MDEKILKLTNTELFYLKDIASKAYFSAKENGEDETVLKYYLSISNKAHKLKLKKEA